MAWSVDKLLTFLQTFAVDETLTEAQLIEFIELRYDEIYNDALNFYKIEETFSTSNGTRYYYLPRHLNLENGVNFYNQSDDTFDITVVDYQTILKADPDEDEDATPEYAALVEMSAVTRQPSEDVSGGTDTLEVVSSSSSDNGSTDLITISGRATSGGNEFNTTEEVTLNGTTPVSVDNTWVYIREFSKQTTTTGHVRLEDSTNSNIYAIIDPFAFDSEYQKWALWPTPDASQTIKVVGYRHPIVPQAGSARIDVPKSLHTGFIHGLRSDVHRINFDFIMAEKYEAKFQKSLQRYKENTMWNRDADFSEVVKDKEMHPLANVEDVDDTITIEGVES